jgi:hypothetical protein
MTSEMCMIHNTTYDFFYILVQPGNGLLKAETYRCWFYIKISVVFDGCVYWFILD